ncbi:uncharacterized protein SPSK_00637 [Sporothrix schenckii 1099-18]|uniref:Uncharacterized protein n=1 Tax=Sporothrix schenckii 1099-18 TaxID=1397361 RepID=A0A0F2LT62_SPOSC|nr:uncharacterized protein SPSK_00637 [Sporothrix schenckii 1099-18]KJR80044.1 hypothetical protein SPSK_00637 [Sporothrix schenckii 1099-18]
MSGARSSGKGAVPVQTREHEGPGTTDVFSDTETNATRSDERQLQLFGGLDMRRHHSCVAVVGGVPLWLSIPSLSLWRVEVAV